MTSLAGNSAADGRGHGTFVAGLAAGVGSNYAGAAPGAPLVSIDVMDDQGMARTSDVIAAADWILANKNTYNIRVANFSLHSSVPNSFMFDPLAKAVERLWFNGVTVVTAAGNYAVDGQPSGVLFAPGSDPFVITVGATDIGKYLSTEDDSAAPWSAYGYTPDGFRKPELGAPGRYMIGPVPTGSTLVAQRPEQVRGTGYMELSGTSLAAPVVAGMAAYLLATHPTWTPDQVKGALMLTAKPAGRAAQWSLGVGEAMAQKANYVYEPAEPERGAEPVRRLGSAERRPEGLRHGFLGQPGHGQRLLGERLLGLGLLGERLVGERLLGERLVGERPRGPRPPGRARPWRRPRGRRPPGRCRPSRTARRSSRHRRPDPDARGGADPRAARGGRANRTDDPLARAHRRRRARPALAAGRALSRPGPGSARRLWRLSAEAAYRPPREALGRGFGDRRRGGRRAHARRARAGGLQGEDLGRHADADREREERQARPQAEEGPAGDAPDRRRGERHGRTSRSRGSSSRRSS